MLRDRSETSDAKGCSISAVRPEQEEVPIYTGEITTWVIPGSDRDAVSFKASDYGLEMGFRSILQLILGKISNQSRIVQDLPVPGFL